MLTAHFNVHDTWIRATVFALHDSEVVLEAYRGGEMLQVGMDLVGVLLFRDEDHIATLLEVSIKQSLEISQDCTYVVGWVKRTFVTMEGPYRESLASNEFLLLARKIATEANLTDQILPEFKLAIVNLTDKLERIKEGLNHEMPESKAARDSVRKSLLMDNIEDEFVLFEQAAAKVPDELAPFHRSYANRKLKGLLMESAFLKRVITKPRHYQGDFETIKILLQMVPPEDNTLFGDILSAWALQQRPALAHQNRIELLRIQIELEIENAKARGQQRVSILNVGCGPAKELIKLRGNYGIPVDITLIDFDEDALADLSDRFRRADLGSRGIHLIPQCANAIVLRKTLSKSSAESVYDFVYCAGLIDYRENKSAGGIVRALVRALRPGGLAMFTNVSRQNPYHYFMNWVLDWAVEERDKEQLKSLLGQSDIDVEAVVIEEWTGVNLFLVVRKVPKNVAGK